MKYRIFLDTNSLLNLGVKAFEEVEPFVISQITLEEIEVIKVDSRKDGEIKYKARMVARLLDENEDKYEVVPYDSIVDDHVSNKNVSLTPDNIIVASADLYSKIHEVPILFVSDDINLKFISRKIFGLLTKGTNELHLVDGEEYVGYKTVTMNDEEMAHFYSHLDENTYDLLTNQYLVVKNTDGDIVDNRCWNGFEYRLLKYKQVSNDFMGKIKPRNNEQMLAFDMLQDKATTIKILTGVMGSGKDYLQIANALRLVKLGEYDRIVYMRNPIQVKDIKELGFLPGSLTEKMKPVVMALADHLGGETGLEMKMMSGEIVVEHLGYIRGRTYNNSIVYVSEAENLTKEHMQLLISRIGEGSSLWINGDFKQVDSPVFRMNNGLLAAINCLKGQKEFGYVKLDKPERSKTAELAELLG